MAKVDYSRRISEDFDWSEPNYEYAITRRYYMLKWLRSGTKEEKRDKIKRLYDLYRIDPAQMIEDWGCTYDPRNAGQVDDNDEAIPTVMPFVLFPKQREWVEWAFTRWLNKQEGVTEKSRDMGVSWLAMALSCCLCILYPEMAIGFGSRKEEYVDKAGFPRSLFFKGRLFMDNLPVEFSGGWSRKTDAHMRLSFPATGSVITGESGDSIGRGDRTGLFFTDEDAQIEHPDTVDAALSATTDCRIRVSSANGTANSFYLKRQQYHSTDQLFTLHWRDNPLKSQEWYDTKSAEVNNPVIMAQEYDINYAASVEGVLIPSSWVNSAMDAHKKLGFGFDGERYAALDVADTGKDKNALCGAFGVIVEHLEDWSGAASDLYVTTERTFGICDLKRYRKFRYDASGLGAGIRGDANKINRERRGTHSILVEPWVAAEIVEPDKKIPGLDRTQREFFANGKAQGYYALRERFRLTFLAVESLKKMSAKEALKKYPQENLISFDTTALDQKALARATVELSQPTAAPNGAGKWAVDKAPDGAPSPNWADCIMMRFAPTKRTGFMNKAGYDAIMREMANG